MNSVALGNKIASISMVLFLCGGCLGTETGNPSETRRVSMAMVLKSSNSAIAQCPTEEPEGTTKGLTIQNAWLATDHIAMHACTADTTSRVDATAWNLLHPVARSVETHEPTFCGFDFQTQIADAALGTIPTQIAGASIWLSAVRSDAVPVDIRSPVILSVRKDDPSVPLASTKLVIALDAADWLANIDFNTLTAGSDGVIHVTPSSNVVELHVFEQQTSAEITLRSEEANDGVMDN